jgi:hypothetical protein
MLVSKEFLLAILLVLGHPVIFDASVAITALLILGIRWPMFTFRASNWHDTPCNLNVVHEYAAIIAALSIDTEDYVSEDKLLQCWKY